MKKLENMNANELLKLKNDVDHRLWRMGFDNKHSIEKSLIDITEALNSLNETLKRIENSGTGEPVPTKIQFDRTSDDVLNK